MTLKEFLGVFTETTEIMVNRTTDESRKETLFFGLVGTFKKHYSFIRLSEKEIKKAVQRDEYIEIII